MLVTAQTTNFDQFTSQDRHESTDNKSVRIVKTNFDVESNSIVRDSKFSLHRGPSDSFDYTTRWLLRFDEVDFWMTLIRIKLIFCRCVWSIHRRVDMVVSCIGMKVLVACFYGKFHNFII